MDRSMKKVENHWFRSEVSKLFCQRAT